MARNRWRFDPYKNFNFRVVAAAAVAGVAAFGATKLFGSRRKKRPRPTELDSGARPIEAVGTSTAGFVGTAPRKAGKRKTRRNG